MDGTGTIEAIHLAPESGAVSALVHRGGLEADIVASGVIEPGDETEQL